MFRLRTRKRDTEDNKNRDGNHENVGIFHII
jgi:hypothetical protein